MRLNTREIEQEIEESIADGTTLKGSRSSTETRVRAPYSSRNRRHSSEGSGNSSRSRKTDSQEGAL